MFELNKKTMKNVFLGVAACIVLYWLLHETERAQSVYGLFMGIVSPFITGAVIAFILNVPMRSIEGMLRKVENPGLKRTIAVVLTVIVVLLVLTLVFLLLIPQLTQTVESLIPQLKAFILRAEEMFYDFLAENPDVMNWVYSNTDLESFDWGALAEKVVTMLGESVSKITSGTFSAISAVMGVMFDLVIAIVFAIYCLFQKETLARQGRKLAYAFLRERTADSTIRILRLTNSTFSNFLSGQCIEVVILGSMFAISMAIFRMPYIPLISVLIAVTAFIPIVGAWIGCVVGAFLILVVNPMQAVWFVIMFLVIQQIEGNLIYPKVVGTSIGLSGMWVLVAVAVGGELMGIAGMFLMIPAASVLYTLLRESIQVRLTKREIAEEKISAQPPELISHFKAKREKNKKKWAEKKQNRAKKTE